MKFLLFLVPLLISFAVQAQDYDCKISHTMVRPEGELTSTWHFFIKDSTGIIKLDGILSNKGNDNIIISRQIFFNVDKLSKHGYYLTSQRIKKNPAENINDEIIANYYPDFFIYENRKTMFTITQGMIISWATDPMFFCY